MAIQKPDWFKMDPAKFLCDAQVDVMSTLELGACLRLLCRQWIDGCIPDDQRVLARLCRLDAAAMGEAWVTLSNFFPIVEAGKRANRFMWIEREKVIADLERKSDEGTRAARKRWASKRSERIAPDATPNAGPNGSPMPDPMQDQTRAEQTRTEKNSSSEQQTCSDVARLSTQKKTSKPPSQEACRLAALLKSEILRNKADYRVMPAQERNWSTTAQRMLDIDKREPAGIADLIRWVQRDEFWMANVLSMDTLREKFDQLALKRAHSKTNGQAARKAAQYPNWLPPQNIPDDYISEGTKRKQAIEASRQVAHG
jgi:uncharacterized protein YdaU (DUF1376 family)